MPFSWKTSRVSRLSRIVADLQPPNRQNSLVVETGFPTSLIDLFVKNKERLKMRSINKKKKKQKRSVFAEEIVRDMEIISGYVCDCDIGEDSLRRDNLEQQSTSLVPCVDSKAGDLSESQIDRRVVMLSVLKMFVMMVLALSTKGLAVGITVSAFVLMFFEYVTVSKHLSRFSNPHLIQSFLSCFGKVMSVKLVIFNWVENDEKVAAVSDSCDVVDVIEYKSCVEETEMESDPDLVVLPVEENRIMEANLDQFGGDKASGCLDAERKVRDADLGGDRIGDLILQKEESQRNRIKSKIIKKLVPKKLRKGGIVKKGLKRKEKAGEFESLAQQEQSGRQVLPSDLSKPMREKSLEEQDEEVEEDKKKVEAGPDQGIHRCSSSGFYATQEGDSFGRICRTRSVGFLAEKVVEDRLQIQRKGKLGYLILLLIVLSGLVGGRLLAFAFTVSSCLIFKLIQGNQETSERTTR